MTTRHFQRAVSAVATAVGRPSLLASTRLPSFWAAVPAAAAGAPQVATQSSDVFAFLSSFGVPTAVILATTAGLYAIGQQVGELKGQVAASEKTIATITASTATKIAANKESAASAIAATEAKLAANEKAATAVIVANKEAAASAIAATEAKLAANEKAATAVIAANKESAASAIAANKESAASAIASTEAKLAAAEKVIAAMMAGVSVAAELATLKALKGELKRETPKDVTKDD